MSEETLKPLSEVWKEIVESAWKGGWDGCQKHSGVPIRYEQPNEVWIIDKHWPFHFIAETLLFSHDFIKAAFTGSGKDPNKLYGSAGHVIMALYQHKLMDLALIRENDDRARYLLKVLTEDTL